DVKGSFNDDRAPGGGDPLSLFADSVQGLSLVVDGGVRSIQVLRHFRAGSGGGPADEGNGPLRGIVDGEDDPVAESVEELTGSAGGGKAGGEQFSAGVGGVGEVVDEVGPAGRGVAEAPWFPRVRLDERAE